MSWEEVRLEDITLKIASGSTPTGGKDNYKESGISLIRSLNVHNFKFLYKDLAFIDITQSKKLSNVIVKRDDILLNITGASVGRCTIVPENILPARVNQHVMIIRANNEIVNSNFLLYLINSKQYKSKLLMLSETGATREALTKDDISNFKIKLPSLKIQNKIANILSNYDNLIENNNKRIKLLENMAEELYKEWFVRLRFPNYQNTKIVDGIPDGWEEVKLEDVTSFLGDGLHGTPEYEDDGEYFFINGNNLQNGKIVLTNTTKRTNISEYIKYKKNMSNNTIMVSINGTLGNIAFYDNEKVFLGKSICYFNVNECISKYLLKCILLNNNFQSYINVNATGATIKNVSLKSMRNFLLILPRREIIEKFDKLIIPIFNKILILQKKNQNLKETRDLLLPRLISGKLDIKDLHIV